MGEYRVADVKAYDVLQWLGMITFGAASKGRARTLLKRLIDKSMLWEYLRLERNPMELVKVKGSTKQIKELVIITPG